MKDETKAEYRRKAEYFYQKYLDGQPPTEKRLKDALNRAGSDYTNATWRGYRVAIEFDQREKGYEAVADATKAIQHPAWVGHLASCAEHQQQIDALDNELRTTGSENMTTAERKAKGAQLKQMKAKGVAKSRLGKAGRPKQRGVSDKDRSKLFKAVGSSRSQNELKAAMLVIADTGIRPAELDSLTFIKPNTLRVEGAKKSDDGLRGADRDIVITDENTARNIEIAMMHLDAMEVNGASSKQKILEARFERLRNKVFKNRKVKPSFYSFRHQMGSNLKASGMTPEEQAYIMGHQSTRSIERYGDKRANNGNTKIKPAVAPSNVRTPVRENSAIPQAAPERDTSSSYDY